ncbi:MAG: DUF6152 family protein [Candidatus Rariloculaceae bacterium]
MRSRFVPLTLLAGMASMANAHHGITGQFDTSTTFEISGVVTGLDFVNPHSYVNFEVTSDDGSVVPWRCEMRAATVLKRSGWTEDMFTPGTPMHIVGSPDRRDEQTCYMVRVRFDSGLTLERYGQIEPGDAADVVPEQRPLRLANGQPNISGDWAASQRLLQGTAVLGNGGMGMGMGMGGGRPAGIEPTEAGLATASGYVAATDNPRFQCMPVNIFNDWTFDQHVNRITQSDDRITLQYGFMDLVRVIHLGRREHPADIVPSKAGHSIGF